MGERQILDIPLAGGLKQREAEPYLDPTAQVSASNAIWVQTNAIEKAPGWLSLPNAIRTNGLAPFSWLPATLQSSQGLFPNGSGNYAVTDGESVYADAQAAGALTWCDFVPPCVGTRRTVSSSSFGVANPEVALVNGVLVYVWEDAVTGLGGGGNLLYYALVNQATGEVFQKGRVAATAPGYQPKMIVVGDIVSVFWAGSSGGAAAADIYVATMAITSPMGAAAWNAFQTIETDHLNLGLKGNWDVAALHGNANPLAALVYEISDVSTAFAIRILSLSGTTWSQINSTIGVVGGLSLSAIGARWQYDGAGLVSTLWVAYAEESTGAATLVSVAAYTVALPGGAVTSLLAPTQIDSEASATPLSTIRSIAVEDVSPAGDGSIAFVVFGSDPASTLTPGIFFCTITNAGVFSVGRRAWNLTLQSRPFAVASSDTVYGCRCYVMVADTSQQATQLVVDLDLNGTSNTPRAVASIAPRLSAFKIPGGGPTTLRGAGSLSSVTNQGTRTPGQFYLAGVLTETSNAPSNLSAIGITIDFAHPGRFLSVRLGNLDYTAGGIPGVFDGQNMVESSTLYVAGVDPTSGSGLTGVATGGNLINGQTYTYVFVPEWRDDNGNVYQGEPSSPVSVAIPSGTGSAGSVTGFLQTLAVTQKGLFYRQSFFGQSALYMVPYRCAIVGGIIGTNLQRTVGDGPGAAYINDGSTFNIPFTDTKSDALVATGELLYTTGGTLSNDAPSSFIAVCTHNGRVYGIGDDLHTIWISTPQQDGVPCTFSDGAQINISFLGDLVAIWSMDANLFVASATGIAYMTGSGPNAQGQASDLSPPTQIPSDVGVVDPRAVCVTPQGTVFQHAQGMGLLDRSLSVHSDFGDPVLAQLAGKTVTGIVMHPTRPEVLVFVAPAGGSGNGGEGGVLLYNYRFGAWSTRTIFDPTVRGSEFQMLPQAALTAGGLVYAVNSTGLVVRECVMTDNLPYFDFVGDLFVFTWVTLQVITGWVKPGGALQGWGRLIEAQLLFDLQDWAGLDVSFGYDYVSGAFSTAQEFTSAQISAFPEVQGQVGTRSRVAFRPFQARCSSAQLCISDRQPATEPMANTGQGIRIVGVAATVENKGGAQRVPAGQRA